MRASAKPSPPGRRDDAGRSVEVVARRRLPRPVVWLLWLIGAMIGSVVLGFLAGLTRPREPDPWTAGSPPYPPPEPPTSAGPGSRGPRSGAEDE